MAGGEDPPRLVGESRKHTRGDGERIGVRAQLLLFLLPEQRLALDVGAQHHRPGGRIKVRRQRARQNGFSGSGESPDCDQCRACGYDAAASTIEILPCTGFRRGLLLWNDVGQPRGADLGADRGAH